jgi:hypothetical protein
MTRAQNIRLVAQQNLETAVKGIDLIRADDKYAPRAAVAGGLATLVRLGHAIIAVRCVAAALADEAVDIASAVWLVDEALARGDAQTQIEAADLLWRNAERLVPEDKPGTFHWPARWIEDWRVDVPLDARISLCMAALVAYNSRTRVWWREHDDVLSIAYAAMSEETDPNLRAQWAKVVLVLADANDQDGAFTKHGKWRTYRQVREEANRVPTSREGVASIYGEIRKLRAPLPTEPHGSGPT